MIFLQKIFPKEKAATSVTAFQLRGTRD